MNTNKYLFEDAPVPKAVATMAIPTMISMLVVVIYNMADTFFIGQTGDPMQVAAVSLATPVFMVFMALGNLLNVQNRFHPFAATPLWAWESSWQLYFSLAWTLS